MFKFNLVIVLWPKCLTKCAVRASSAKSEGQLPAIGTDLEHTGATTMYCHAAGVQRAV